MSDWLILLAMGLGFGSFVYVVARKAQKNQLRWYEAIRQARLEMTQLGVADEILPLTLRQTWYNRGGYNSAPDEYWMLGVSPDTQTAYLWRIWSDKVDRYQAKVEDTYVKLPPVPAGGSWKVVNGGFGVGLSTDKDAEVFTHSNGLALNNEAIGNRSYDRTPEEIIKIINSLHGYGLTVDSSDFFDEHRSLLKTD